MTTRKFKKFAKFLDILLMLGSAVFVVITGVLLMLFVTKNTSFLLFEPTSGFTVFSAIANSPENKLQLAVGLLVNIPVGLSYAVIFFKGSRFFKSLSQNKTPFSTENKKLISRIGISLMILGVVPSIINSLVLSFLMTNGYYIKLDIGLSFLMGAIIYCASEVIHYGVKLQQFSDDAV